MRAFVWLCVLVGGSAGASRGATPVNDNFANAVAITGLNTLCSFGERAEGENRQGGPAAGGTRGLVRELWKKEPSIRRGGQLESLVGLG